MEQGLMVNTGAYLKSPDSYSSDIATALRTLATASESQFQEIKAERWYNRLFDLVTFSQKGKKRVAEQISQLAQAQQILIEVLVRLAGMDANLSEIIRENSSLIHALSEQNAKIADRMVQVEQIVKYGATRCYDVNALNKEEKRLLAFCLSYVSSREESPAEMQMDYVRQVLNYADQGLWDFDTDRMFSLFDAVADASVRKTILLSGLEYIFLHDTANEQFLQTEIAKDFLWRFDCGPRTAASLEKYILKTYRAVGGRGLIEKYTPAVFAPVDDEFWINFQADPEEIWDAKRIQRWFQANRPSGDCVLHIVDAGRTNLARYHFRDAETIGPDTILLVVYDNERQKPVRHSCLRRELVSQGILNQLNGGNENYG